MGIFDIDSGADNHLLNEQFHVFSKSPASVATALGDASNRSGHTVTASDVWGQEIPAFFYAKTQAVAETYKPLAKTNDLCRIGNSVAIFENGNWVVKYNSYTDIPDGHKFKNAAGDDVIRFHKNRLAYNLNLDNNAADDGLNTTAKIQGWDEENGKVYDYVATAPKFVTQFVTSTDKIVDGIPSKGFGPFVMAGTTTGDITKVLPEGTSDQNHYIANSFAGIIQFNKARTDAIYVHAFEYCGKTLKSAYSDIVELEDKLGKISVTASGGIQGVSEDATTAGLSTKWVKLVEGEEVDAQPNEEGAYPVLTIETTDLSGAEGSTTLITGGVAHSIATYYADLAVNTALDEGGSIAEYVENYVSTNAKVSVNGQSATTITVAGTDTSSNDLVKIAVAEDKDTDNEIGLTLTATVDTATVTDGAVKSGDESKLVTAGDAANIAEKAAAGVNVGVTSITINNGTKQTGDVAISVVTGTISVASGTDYPNNPYGIGIGLDDNKAYAQVQPAVYNSASKAFTSATSNYLTTASGVTAYVTDAISDAISGIDFPDVKVEGGSDTYGISFTTESGEGAGSSHYMHIATAAYTPASGETAASWTDKGYLITGATVEAFVDAEVGKVADDLTALENKVNAYHKAGVSYKVLQSLPSPSVDYNGVIVLVPTDNGVTPEGDEKQAISGSYVEWLCVNYGTEEAPQWKWEQIGTTAADLHGYVSGIYDSNLKNDSTRTSPVYASISSAGYLSLGIDSATSDKLGVSKLFTGNYLQMASVADKSNTAVSLETVSEMFSRQDGTYVKSGTVVNSVNGLKGNVTLCVHNYPDTFRSSESEGTSSSLTTTDSNLWGMGVVSGKNNHNTYQAISIIDTFVGMSASYLTTANLPVDAVSVENNFVYNGAGDVITTIRPERMVRGFNAKTAPNLKSFIGDLSNLKTAKCGNNHDDKTFYSSSALELFIGDLSSLTDGYCMFYHCNKLNTFISDLSNLTNGQCMFEDCKLDAESLECIADTINDVRSWTTSTEVTKQIDIGYNCSAADAQAAQIAIEAKGWTCSMTYNA